MLQQMVLEPSYPTGIDVTTEQEPLYEEGQMGYGGQYYGFRLTHQFRTATGGEIDSSIQITEQVTIHRDDFSGLYGTSHKLGEQIWAGGLIRGTEIADLIGTPIDTKGVLTHNRPPLICSETQEFFYRVGESGNWTRICGIAITVTLSQTFQVQTTVNGVTVKQKSKYRQINIPGIGPAMDIKGKEYLTELNK